MVEEDPDDHEDPEASRAVRPWPLLALRRVCHPLRGWGLRGLRVTTKSLFRLPNYQRASGTPEAHHPYSALRFPIRANLPKFSMLHRRHNRTGPTCNYRERISSHGQFQPSAPLRVSVAGSEIADRDRPAGFPPRADGREAKDEFAEARRVCHRNRLTQPDPPPKRGSVRAKNGRRCEPCCTSRRPSRAERARSMPSVMGISLNDARRRFLYK